VNKTRSEFNLHCLIVQQTGSQSLIHHHIYLPISPVREKTVRSISRCSVTNDFCANIEPEVRLLNDCYAKVPVADRAILMMILTRRKGRHEQPAGRTITHRVEREGTEQVTRMCVGGRRKPPVPPHHDIPKTPVFTRQSQDISTQPPLGFSPALSQCRQGTGNN
jgi:hypothetical protein